MRVSEVLQVQFPQAKFFSGDKNTVPQSGTFHSRNRYVKKSNNKQNDKTRKKRHKSKYQI